MEHPEEALERDDEEERIQNVGIGMYIIGMWELDEMKDRGNLSEKGSFVFN